MTAISFVGSAATGRAGATGTWTFNMSDLRDAAGAQPTPLQNDFVIVCQAVGRLGIDILGLISNPGSSLTKRIASQSSASTFTSNLFLYHKHLPASPDTTLTLPESGHIQAGTGLTVHVFRGVNLASPFDVSDVIGTANGHSAPNPGSITPSSSGAWPFVCGAGADNVAVSLSNSGDLSTTTNHFRAANGSDNVNGGVGAGFKTDWTSGAFNAAQFGGGVSDASNSWVAAALVLRPATESLVFNPQQVYAPFLAR